MAGRSFARHSWNVSIAMWTIDMAKVCFYPFWKYRQLIVAEGSFCGADTHRASIVCRKGCIIAVVLSDILPQSVIALEDPCHPCDRFCLKLRNDSCERCALLPSSWKLGCAEPELRENCLLRPRHGLHKRHYWFGRFLFPHPDGAQIADASSAENRYSRNFRDRLSVGICILQELCVYWWEQCDCGKFY